MLVLLGGLQVTEKAFGLPSFLRQSTTSICDPAVFYPPRFFSISSTCYGGALASKKKARAYVDGGTYTVRVDDVYVIQLTKR